MTVARGYKNTRAKRDAFAQRLEATTKGDANHGQNLKSFDMEISNGTGTHILHSATGEITSEMKAAIKELADGDSIYFTHIATTYVANRQVVKMNLNYVISYRIDALG